MEVCEYSEATVAAALNPKGIGKHLVFKPSLAYSEIKNTEDQERYFEEVERYSQARLAYLLNIETARVLLRAAHSGAEDVFHKRVDTKRALTPVKLQLETNVQDIIKLTEVTVCGGQGGETTMGTLEAHVNGFRYKTSSGHPHIDVIYEYIKCAFYRVGDYEKPPLLHFHLHNQIMLGGEEETIDIKFHLKTTLVGQTDSRNKELQDFVDKVDDLWDSKTTTNNLFETPAYEIHGVFPTKAPAVFALTYSSLVELAETTPIVVSLDDIKIVNLAKLRADEIDMTVVFKDLTRPVLQINSTSIELLSGIKHRLNFARVKYYENEQELDWNGVVKKFRDSPEEFIKIGGWEFLNLEASDASDCYSWEEYGDSDNEKLNEML